MKRITPLILAAASAMLLSACETDMGSHDRYAAYDGYYDGFYGPYNGGYWDGDSFYYRDHDGFVIDGGHHFHHERFHGGVGFRVVPRP